MNDAFLIEKYVQYRAMLKENEVVAPLVPYNWASMPCEYNMDTDQELGRWIFNNYLNDFARELANSINELIVNVKRIQAWDAVLQNCEAVDKLNVLHEFVTPLAINSLNLPYAIQARFYFSVTHISHQANRFTMGDKWVDDLEADSCIDQKTAQMRAKDWSNWKKLCAELNNVSKPAYKKATDNFRNKYNHRFPSQIEMGITQTIKRSTQTIKLSPQ